MRSACRGVLPQVGKICTLGARAKAALFISVPYGYFRIRSGTSIETAGRTLALPAFLSRLKSLLRGSIWALVIADSVGDPAQ